MDKERLERFIVREPLIFTKGRKPEPIKPTRPDDRDTSAAAPAPRS